jgi:hypothetical protein
MGTRNPLGTLMERKIYDSVGNRTPAIQQVAILLTGLILSLSTQLYPSIEITTLNPAFVPIKFDSLKAVAFLVLAEDSLFVARPNPETYRSCRRQKFDFYLVFTKTFNP